MVNNSVPAIKLNNGLQMPIVGLGTYARKSEPEQFQQAVEWAIEAGYRHIDTAACYNNEERVGAGIANKIKEGIVKREDLFVTTKLWNDKHAQNDVVPALKSQLARLQLDYIDLYLIHWPVSVNDKGEETAIDYLETWKGMEETVKLCLAKSIGVSNFNKDQLERLLRHASIKPTVNQFEISPTLTQHDLVDFCVSQSVVPVAYTPLGLISEARPEFEKYATIKNDPKIKAVAEKYGKSLAQIGLKYLVQRGIAVVPKSFTRSRIQDNINIFDFQLTEEDMAVVDSFNLNFRCVPANHFQKYTYYPFH